MATTRPGVQNPHWTAPSLIKASCTSVNSPREGWSPSMVVISLPTAAAASTRQAQTRAPSMITEHEPHSPCSQPDFDPGSSSRSRST